MNSKRETVPIHNHSPIIDQQNIGLIRQIPVDQVI